MSKTFIKSMPTFLWTMRHSYLCTSCFLQGTSHSYCSRHCKRFREVKMCRKEGLDRNGKKPFVLNTKRHHSSESGYKKELPWIDNSYWRTRRRLTQRNRHHYWEIVKQHYQLYHSDSIIGSMCIYVVFHFIEHILQQDIDPEQLMV